EVQESVLRDGPPTGVLQGRSYDPWEALRAVEVAVPFDGKSLLFQSVHLHGRLEDGRPVQIFAVFLRQSGQGFLARCGVEGRRREADELGRPEPQGVGREVAVPGIEDVVLSPVGQGRAEGVAARLRENEGGWAV